MVTILLTRVGSTGDFFIKIGIYVQPSTSLYVYMCLVPCHSTKRVYSYCEDSCDNKGNRMFSSTSIPKFFLISKPDQIRPKQY